MIQSILMKRWGRLVLLFCSALIACACGGSANTSDDEDTDLIGGKEDSAYTKLAYTRISSAAQFDAMAFASAGNLIQGKALKFLIDARNSSSLKIYFMNANYKPQAGQNADAARYHYYFAKAVLPNFSESIESFNNSTYYENKRFFAGTIQVYRLANHAQPLYGIQFYPNDTIKEQTILQAIRVILPKFIVSNSDRAFVATGSQQTATQIASDLAQLNVDNLTTESVLGSVNYLPMNLGEAWGYLRIFPKDTNAMSAADIVVLDELPLDLTVVAATITKDFQDPSCHVNLKAKERNTPNMVLRDASLDQALLSPFDNLPVHLVVGPNEFSLEASTDEVIMQKLTEKNNQPWIPLQYEAETRVLSYVDMCPSLPSDCLDLAKKYGSKAANLGFLISPTILGRQTDSGSLSATFGYDLATPGVGVPIQFYWDFVAYSPNQTLRDAIDELVQKEKSAILSSAERVLLVQRVQEQFYLAQFPPQMVSQIRQALADKLPGINRLKVRSSANSEDLANFDGAGLYNSFSARLQISDNPDGSCQKVVNNDDVETKEEMSPRTLACAIKGAYASTWNKRAIEERTFARLDHVTAAMGLAIVPTYSTGSEVEANSVLITRLVGSQGIYGYTLSTQQGDNLVTNPSPGTISESVAATFADASGIPTVTVWRYATPVANQPPLNATVLTEAQIKDVVRIGIQVEKGYCRNKPGYFPGSCNYVFLDPEKPKSLDLEFKILENGRYLCKQTREFSGK